MKKRVLRIIGLLPLLLAMTVFGTGVSAAGPGTATLTQAKTWIKIHDPSQPDWARSYMCEFWIANPSKDGIKVWIKWDQPGFNFVGGPAGKYSDTTIHDTGGDLVNSPVSEITIRGENTTTNNIDFEVTVPMPGTWP